MLLPQKSRLKKLKRKIKCILCTSVWSNRDSEATKVGTNEIDDVQGCDKIALNLILWYSDGEELLQFKGDVCKVEVIHVAVLSQIWFHCEEFAVGFGGSTNDSCDFCSDFRPGRLSGCLLKSSQIEEGGCESLTGDGISIESWVE